MKKKVNLPSKVLKGIRDLHAIIVRRLVTHQTNVEAMENKNSMESATTIICMVTKPMNPRRNQNLKVNVTNAKSLGTRHQNANPNHSIQLNNLQRQCLDEIIIPGADVIIMENMDILA